MNNQANISQHIMDSISESIYWMDKDGKIVGCNKKQLELFGLSERSQLIGKNIFDVADFLKWPDAIPDKIRQHDLTVVSEGRKVITEEMVILNGKKRIFLVQKEPWLDSKSGKIIGILGFSIDVSEKNRAEQLTKKADITAQVFEKIKTALSCLSYEIRGPMSGIRLGLDNTYNFFDKLTGFLESTQNSLECQSTDQVTVEEVIHYQSLLSKMVKRIDTSIALMDMQLKNIMTDRIEQSCFQLQKIKISIEQAVNTFPLEHEGLRRKIHLHIQHDFNIYGDGLLTKYMLWNLLNNALHVIKAEEQGEIFITTEEMIDYHLLRFRDTSQGISVTQARQGLEPFHTNYSRDVSLGVHFCQSVMKAYNGKIECYAREGQYTEFLLFFPKDTKRT